MGAQAHLDLALSAFNLAIEITAMVPARHRAPKPEH
jgi:hypothetical protein